MATDTKDTTLTGQAFDQFLEGQLADPSFRAGFEKKLAKIKSIAEVLQIIEAARERENIPKAELARRMERKPEAISRLLRGQGANPTLDTLIDLIDAIGLELDIRIRRQPVKRSGDYSPLKVHSTV
ncbi:MAG TPA: XRE family transcriptional regulator [Solirubrobacteraceae bacterium]|jgi:DNA-binding phage protein